ncbi:MAG: hypothetical protein LUQ26_09580 [Methylococcaceae bacterium]|nr:hypothetical protein [Methylococcaceae bacterium]
MADGPGIYDFICTQVREQTSAKGVVILIIDGAIGSGFSVQTSSLELNDALPAVLEDMARQIRETGFETTED